MKNAQPVAIIAAIAFAGLSFAAPASERVSLAGLQASINELSARVDVLEKDNVALTETAKMLEAENQVLRDQLACISLASDATNLYLEGCNVHVRNGAGATASINGVGNLIVGYDRERPSESNKTGSHNLVVGDDHNYTSFGGIVSGIRNAITGEWASVSGGSQNTASGNAASVSGGLLNTASGFRSSVSGGQRNTASNNESSVSGGLFNTANGPGSSVSGGRTNAASGTDSSVSGGFNRSVTGETDWAAGSLFQEE